MREKGVVVVFVLAAVLVLAIGLIGGVVVFDNSKIDSVQNLANTVNKKNNRSGNKNAGWIFDFDSQRWQATGNSPTCPDPLTINSPVEVDQVSGILYPGQFRGDDYKPHGGFRFLNDNNLVDVFAPMDGYLFKGSRHLAQGEIQYSMFFINDCGVMYKLDHLRTLTKDFKNLFSEFADPVEGDSRTSEISPRVFVESGELIATEIGFRQDNNVFVDFGLYDLREKNEISKDPLWVATHPGQEEFGVHGLCWLENLPVGTADIFKSLPVAGVEGNTSDYCD